MGGARPTIDARHFGSVGRLDAIHAGCLRRRHDPERLTSRRSMAGSLCGAHGRRMGSQPHSGTPCCGTGWEHRSPVEVRFTDAFVQARPARPRSPQMPRLRRAHPRRRTRMLDVRARSRGGAERRAGAWRGGARARASVGVGDGPVRTGSGHQRSRYRAHGHATAVGLGVRRYDVHVAGDGSRHWRGGDE